MEQNFDLLSREFMIGSQKSCLYFIDGDGYGQVTTQIMRAFMDYGKSGPKEKITAKDAMDRLIPFVEIDEVTEYEKSIDMLLAGTVMLIIDGISKAFIIDAKNFPQRTVGEPEKDKVIRGSHDGFVEIPIFNAALIRRRIRSTNLLMEGFTVGKESHSDVVVCYMKDRCNETFLEALKKQIQDLEIEALTMNQETLAENLFPRKWYNPYPLVRYSERPDETSAAILQGYVVLLVDNSPAAMILPANFLDSIKESNDYYFPPITGTFYRLVKILLLLLSLLLTPVWLCLLQNPESMPQGLNFLIIKEPVAVPLIVQLFVMEFVLEVMRISTINTPNVLGTSISIVGALFVGEFAVKSGWMASEVVFYMSFLAVALYASPDFEFGYAMKFFRMFLLLTTAIFGVWGLAGGIILILLLTITTKNAAGEAYFYPVIPFSWKGIMIRVKRDRLRK